jgi:hypothetical protein
MHFSAYSERTQYVLAQESVGILDMELPCTKHILAQYRGLCPQCEELKHVTYFSSYVAEDHCGLTSEVLRNDPLTSAAV